jgi:endo-beta-N-acetylglucosaminidase D
MKYLLGAALCMALMIDANAAITTLNGTNVTWDVDFESAYFKGLTATVSGDTLRFTRVDGNAIVQSSATGLGAKKSTEIRYSSKNGKLFDDFITVRTMNTLRLQRINARTEGRDSYHLASDSTRLGEITNSITAAVNVWDPLRGLLEVLLIAASVTLALLK